MNLSNYSLWTAVITPLLNDGEVDFESLSSIVNAQCEAQNGLLILGSTGEALNLNLKTRKKIIEHVVHMKPSSPIMVGVGGNLLEEQLEWITYLEQLNVHSYLLVTPHYAKPGAKGQYEWFKTLMDKSTRPCMLYNVPGRTAIALSTDAVSKLNNHKNFWAIKEASGSLEKFNEYLIAAGGKGVYCGDDALMPDFALAGAAGLVSVASNPWPKETHLYVEQCLKKTFDAKELWTKASNSLFVASNPVPVKRLMFEKGMIKSPKLLPPLSDEDMSSASPVLEAHKEISLWFKGAQS
jgi:4-hydroxy-tetrahydrodipicolinate synthase